MSVQFKISAKNLGELALPTFCPYCFWVKQRIKNKLPYQIFPGVFSSIDSYTKDIVHTWFDTHTEALPWLNPVGDIVKVKDSPHFSKFFIEDAELNTKLNGTPDDIFLLRDGSHAIVDYKTARLTGMADELFPMYEIQLNAYALIGKARGFDPVSKLALIYMEPMSLEEIQGENKHNREEGFNMVFSAKVMPVEIDARKVKPLLKKARKIFDMEEPPEGGSECKDCEKLTELVNTCKL